jgi:NAD-dependent DNA ligase
MRAGEVIPEIVSVLTELRDGMERVVEIPKICPICSTPTKQDEGMVAIYCPNPHCPAKIQGQLEMFVGKQGLNIDGLGTKQIELFLELGWITDFASVFDLGSYRDQFFELEGYKEKSVNNLLEAIEKSRHTTLDRVLVALGIPNVGKKTAKLIARSVTQKGQALPVMSSQALAKSRHLTQEFPGKDFSTSSYRTSVEVTEGVFLLTEEKLLEVKDIGPETARAFVEYMLENREMIERLLGKLDILIPEQMLPSSE